MIVDQIEVALWERLQPRCLSECLADIADLSAQTFAQKAGANPSAPAGSCSARCQVDSNPLSKIASVDVDVTVNVTGTPTLRLARSSLRTVRVGAVRDGRRCACSSHEAQGRHVIVPSGSPTSPWQIGMA